MTIKQTIRYTSFLFMFFMYATPYAIWRVSATPEKTKEISVTYGKPSNLTEDERKKYHETKIKVTLGTDGAIDLNTVMKDAWKKYSDEQPKDKDLTAKEVLTYFQSEKKDANPKKRYLSYEVMYTIGQDDANYKAVHQKKLTANSFKYDEAKTKFTYHDGNSEKELSGELLVAIQFIKKSKKPSNKIKWDEVLLAKLIKDHNEERPKKKWDLTALVIGTGLVIIFIRFWPSFSTKENKAKKKNREEELDYEEEVR